MRKEKQDSVTGDILTCTSEGDPEVSVVNCEEGETGILTGDILTCTSEGDPVERDLTCEDGETTSANEGNNGLILDF